MIRQNKEWGQDSKFATAFSDVQVSFKYEDIFWV